MAALWSALWSALVKAYAFLAVVPVVPFLIVFWIVSGRTGDRKRAARRAMDVTTAFLIGIVASLINDLFATRFGLYLIWLFMLLAAGLIGNAQNRARGRVDAARLIRAVWRLTFFATAFLYVLLMIVKLIAAAFGRH